MPPHLSLLRPLNGLIAGAAVVVGALVAVRGGGGAGTPAESPGAVLWWPATLGALSAFAAAGAANALNDAVDAEGDFLNAPRRPIPSGRATRGAAVGLAMALYAASVGLASGVNGSALALAVSWVLVTVAYSLLLKGIPLAGNLAVAAVASSPLLMGGLSQGARLGPGLVLLFALAALLHTARELFKDAEDVRGDSSRGVRTLAVASGAGVAIAVGRALLVAAMPAAMLPLVTGILGPLYLALLVPLEALLASLIAVSFGRGYGAEADRAPGSVAGGLKVAMALGLLAFAAGIV